MDKSVSVSFDEALRLSLDLANISLSSEWVSLMEALGRTVAQDIVCQKNLPSYNNAAMDGFAINYTHKAQTLRIKRRILAGDSVEPCLESGECYKIMTGAKVPDDADTIIPFEESLSYNDISVEIPLHVKQGNALRLKGEDQAIGSLLIEKGEVITSSAIALLASQGITHIEVYRGLKIAVLSTGNELKKPWENASEDEIYDVNAFALIALLKEQGFDAHYGGVIPDDLSIATHYFSTMQAYDVIVTSGGVSMGEADFVEKALQSNGFKASFHGINIKPGKPTMFGVMNQTIVASMPGNPLAAYVNAFLFLIPLLKKQQGQKNFNFNCILALNGADFKVKSGRVNLVLGELRQEKFYAYDDNRYGSGMITPLHKTNAIAICDEETKSIEMGKTVKIVIFKSLFSKVIASLKN